MADSSPATDERTDRPSAGSTQRDIDRATRMMILGAAVAVLAPLFGFLGGTMVGSSSTTEEVDPLVLWLIGGLVVGGIGGLVAIIGVLRWVGIDRHRD